ncbi:universal stress protein [Ferrovibrio sp.]|uniref:universal stress protein n=1 Tax=Ferrovibrio sp. TaxID=1917215 RepID=UPI0025BF072C|nr:universal stress protein [Ferrovibrio sp.]MBX3454989.1 universal stress protein [Ferrovibrio sp.]
MNTTYRDILLHLTDDPRSKAKIDAALGLARRFGSHLIALYTLPPPVMPYYTGEFIPTEFIQKQVDEAQAVAKATHAAFEAAAKREGVAVEWIESEWPALDAVSVYGRAVDLVLVGQPDPEPTDSAPQAPGLSVLPHELALRAGRPILGLPYAGNLPAKLGENILIAWNGSREATRAVHDAMPFLLGAKSVTVYGINADRDRGTPGADLARHLARHDVKVEVSNTVVSDIEVGEALLSAIADRSADLLVMGAYGHSRLREMVFGGVTETILDSMTVPVLFSN